MKIEEVKHLSIDGQKTIIVYLDEKIDNNSLTIVIQRMSDRMCIDKQYWEIQINDLFVKDIISELTDKVKFVDSREFIGKSMLTFIIESTYKFDSGLF